MSDELPDTPDKGIRAFLGALGFIVMLIGAEMMAEKDGARFKLGLVLVLAGLPIFLSAAIWRFVRQYLSANVLIDLRNIAARAARGCGLGVGAAQGLRAQTKPPIYYVVEVDTTDSDAYAKEFAPKAQAIIKAAGGRRSPPMVIIISSGFFPA